jgi:regulation of enolase protein 1 (concanavalin A-like superfamily)/PKD repeat protein
VRRLGRTLVLVFSALIADSVATFTQTAARLAWDADPTATVTGFAVTVDGIRTDYGLTPRQSDGTCNCSIPLPFSSGRHTVTVSAYNASGETATAPFVVGPTANPGGPYSGHAGTAISVSGANSTDNIGTITSYTWKWGDGSANTVSASATAAHTYASVGTFTITLTVADDFAASHTATTTATITAVLQSPGTPTSPNPGTGATGVSTTPTLTWAATAAASYDVQFGTINPPPQVASGLASASYAPGTLTYATTYYWRIVARNSVGTTSGPVWSFTTSSGGSNILPSPWLNQDVGNTGLLGAASYASGIFTVDGAGADIWGTSDAFRFVYQGIAGDGEIVARVTGIENTNAYAKAGVMIRESLAANAPHAMIDVNPTGNAEFESRHTTGGVTSWLAGASQTRPTWLRLTRSGSTIVASLSTDGVTWRPMGSTTLSIATNAVVGLVVTSHNATVLNTSTFDHVSVSRPTTSVPPAAPASPNPSNGATGVSSSPTLTWTSSGATSYDVRFGTTNPPPQVRTGQTVSSYTPGSLTANAMYFWQIVAHNAAGATTGSLWSFTTAAASSATTNIVIYASDIAGSQMHGAWTRASDSTSPNGVKLTTANSGWSTTQQPLAAPIHYFDVPFTANAATPYTLWLRLRAINNDKYNDSVWVQFSDGQVNGSRVYPIGTTSGLLVNLATDSTGTSLNGWGWDNGAYWLLQASTVTFTNAGTHTLRIQVREDGVEIDQIVLSPTTYLGAPPGPPTNDSTIVKK